MQLYPVPGNELPAGMVAGTVTTSDGVQLRYALCPGRPGRGTVCILQGRGDYIERFFETAEDLQARGFAVAMLDWRGQGGSDRPGANPYRAYVGSFRDYERDLTAFMTEVVLPDCPPPYIALAHSTGANVLLRVLAKRNWFERAVLSAPLIDLARLELPIPIIRAAAWLMRLIGLSRVFLPGRRRRPLQPADFPGNLCTSDKRRFLRECRTLEAAPQLGIGGPTFGWLNAAFGSIAHLRRYSSRTRLSAPVLIVAAGDDRLVSSEAARQFARRVPGVAAVTIPGSRHEPLMERNEIREQFWAAFDSFVGSEADTDAGQVSASKALA